ncbi:hypothetical protein AMECASPLE_017010 [Ameca splendens]|uniref:Uncharacterized protein n=1 Tax=Ameca splendens TaxID=208324 RepID=A0ABV0ZYR3_9TELE
MVVGSSCCGDPFFPIKGKMDGVKQRAELELFRRKDWTKTSFCKYEQLVHQNYFSSTSQLLTLFSFNLSKTQKNYQTWKLPLLKYKKAFILQKKKRNLQFIIPQINLEPWSK